MGDNESLCAMDFCLQMKDFHLQQESDLGLLGQQASP